MPIKRRKITLTLSEQCLAFLQKRKEDIGIPISQQVDRLLKEKMETLETSKLFKEASLSERKELY